MNSAAPSPLCSSSALYSPLSPAADERDTSSSQDIQMLDAQPGRQIAGCDVQNALRGCLEQAEIAQYCSPASLSICSGAPNPVECRGSDPMLQCITVCVKSTLAPPLLLPVSPSQSVDQLKEHIAANVGIPAQSLRMLLGSTEPDGGAALSSYQPLFHCTAGFPVVRVQLKLSPGTEPDSVGFFKILPAEITMQVLSMLSVRDIGVISRLSKGMREFTQDSVLWSNLFRRYWCPYAAMTMCKNECTPYGWKELYKIRLDELKPKSLLEYQARTQLDALLDTYQLKGARATLALLEAMIKQHLFMLLQASISFGAPAYNNGDHEACFRFYFGTIKGLVERFSNYTNASPLFKQGLVSLADSLKLSKMASDTSNKAWTLRHGFDEALLLASTQQFYIKGLLNLAERYCTRNSWAEAESSMCKAYEQSLEFLPACQLPCSDWLSCHNYIFFMYIHTLVMQGKYMCATHRLRDAVNLNALARLEDKFKHINTFIQQGYKLCDKALSSNLNCYEIVKIHLLKMYYTYVGSPTPEQHAAAKATLATMMRRELPCLADTFLFFARALDEIVPRQSKPQTTTRAGQLESP